MGDDISSLREELEDKDLVPTKRRELREKLVKLIREKGLVKLKNGDAAEYTIVYDTFGQTLEPVYFWVLDFLRNPEPSGQGFEVNKLEEQFEASVGGGYFGDIGTKASVMQDRAMKILETVNAVLRTLINLIYDLREYDMRLELYNDADPKKQSDSSKRQAAEYSLKGVWLDQVDIKAGLGSINQLTRGDLQFITLRDAFFQATTVKSVKDFDLNKRVKTILAKKLEEYRIWRESSEKELRKRYAIEKNYLKAQVDALRLYTKWARPYLRAAQKLGMKEFLTESNIPSPDVVAAFNNMQMELKLFAKKAVKPEKVHESYKYIEFKEQCFACVEVEFKFRTAPQVARSGQSSHFAHMGVIEMKFRPYALSAEDILDIEKLEVFEDMDLVEHLTDVSLADMQADIDHYVEGDKEKEEKKKTYEVPNPFKGLKDLFSPLKDVSFPTPFGKKKANAYHKQQLLKACQESAHKTCLLVYDIFKKSHGMITW